MTKNSQLVSDNGTYQICFKSGATAIIENVSLDSFNLPGNLTRWVFKRDGKEVSFTPHFQTPDSGGQIPLDSVIDAILRLK